MPGHELYTRRTTILHAILRAMTQPPSIEVLQQHKIDPRLSLVVVWLAREKSQWLLAINRG